MAEEAEDNFEQLPPGIVTRITLLAGTALALALTLVWLLSGGGTQFFHRKFTLHTYLNDAAGLVPGALVTLNGVTIGKVSLVQMEHTTNRQRTIRVDLTMDRTFMNGIPIDSEAAVNQTNLVGDKLINVNRGRAAQHVEDGSELPSQIQSGSFDPADLIKSLRESIQRVDALLSEILTGNTPLAQVVRGDQIYRNIQSQISYVQRLLVGYADRRSPLGKELFGEAVYERLRQPLLDIDRGLAAIQQGQGKLGRYLRSSDDYNNAVAQIRNVRLTLAQNNQGRGAAGPWLTSDERYNRLLGQINSINASVDKLTLPDAGFGKLLASPELYETLNRDATKGRNFAREFREDPQHFMRIQVRGKKKKPTRPNGGTR